MMKAAYVHIPFCKRKCKYCSFVSFDVLEAKGRYVDALCGEIESAYMGEELETLYIGGGTPSLLEISELRKILSRFNLAKNAEITLEANPETLSKSYLKEIFLLGVNRLSVGVQTFDDKLLKEIGRGHTASTAAESIRNAQAAGFSNISIDLIYGLPFQSESDFESSLNFALKLDIQHVSLYGLKIEEGCFYHGHKPKSLPDSDMQADMYLKAVKMLAENGFEHYEISNFSKKGFQSRHNLTYWNNQNYYGFGLSASGYEVNLRYTNHSNLENYFKNPIEKEQKEAISHSARLEEEIFLGLRKLEGIDKTSINQKYGIDFDKKYEKQLEKYLCSSHLKKTEKGYALTIEGVLVSNEILCGFLEEGS